MSKAMLIIDMPESCEKCKLSSCLAPIGVGICCVDREKFGDMTKVQDWCPLREVPKKQEPIPFENDDYYRGYNDCLDEILGGGSSVQANRPN